MWIFFRYCCLFVFLPLLQCKYLSVKMHELYLSYALSLTLIPFSAPFQSSSISVTCCVSLTMGTLRSEGPQPSSVEPSYRPHSSKHVSTYTPGWPVCRLQQVSVCLSLHRPVGLAADKLKVWILFHGALLTCRPVQVTLCPWWTWCLYSRKRSKMSPLSPARWLVLQ